MRLYIHIFIHILNSRTPQNISRRHRIKEETVENVYRKVVQSPKRLRQQSD